MKKYKLLKDLPYLKAGTIIKYDKFNKIISILNLGEGGGVGNAQEVNIVLDGYSEDSFLNKIIYYMLLELLQNDNNKERLEKVQNNKSIYELEEGDEYYYIYDEGEVSDTGIVAGTQIIYNNHLELGNVFLTKEEAEKKLKKIKALTKIKRWIFENGIKLTHKNDFGYVIKYKVNEGIVVNYIREDTYSFCEIIFENVKDAERCLEECKKEREILFDLN